MMAKGVFLHENGWAASSEIRLKQTIRGNKKVFFIEVVAPFHTGEKWQKDVKVDALIITNNGEKHHYDGLVEGMARNGMTKILLTSAGNADKEKIKTVYTKIGEFNHGRTSIAR
jgi:hypothetical protein